MRDRRFVAEHRGGPLSKERHRQLIRWAHACAVHILPYYGEVIDERLNEALSIAKAWEKNKATTGEAMKASVMAHAAARASASASAVAVARAVGHAVATAHMADHSLGAAEYALKALRILGMPVESERKWQDEQLTPDIFELVTSARLAREKQNLHIR